jgi:hypothetical protein
VSYSAEDVRGRIWRAGAKTAGEIEAAMRAIGLTLAGESLWDRELRDRELRVNRARRGNVVAL